MRGSVSLSEIHTCRRKRCSSLRKLHFTTTSTSTTTGSASSLSRQLAAMNNYTECHLCFINYDKNRKRRPRAFPCGHSSCTSCITSLLEQGTEGHLTCPTCRVQHASPKATHFSINHDLAGLIQQVRRLEEQQQQASEITGNQKAPNPVDAAIKELLDLFVSLHFKLSTMTAQIEQAKSNTSQAKHQSLKNQLGEMMADNNEAIRKKAEAEAKYQGLLDESHTIASHLAAVANQLENSVSGREKRAILNVAYSQIREMKRWMKRSEETVASDTTATFSNTVLKSTHNRIKRMAENSGDGEGSACGGGGASGQVYCSQVTALLERVQHSLKRLATCSFMLTPENLRTMNAGMRQLLEEHKVFGLYKDSKVRCWSSLTLENGWLHLYRLQCHPPPYQSYTIQMAHYLCAPPSSQLVFLDLAWHGRVQGRVYIHLEMRLPLAKQFLMLCSGQQGPSYAGTSLLCVNKRNSLGEYVKGGDYNNNDGTGGASLLPHLQAKYRPSSAPGAVWGPFRFEDPRVAQFAITTTVPRGNLERVFGSVEWGMGVVRAAVNAMKKHTVTVRECGVVIRP
ncbi:uncharacterized protein LOC135094001 isoform X2 [Scylla paramamosain]|uniref:uncharacterized protein LOC135094001 isoform X2 n=1 Tax=Scylla paramamosain TaxID=85552 RepID=UPI003083DA8E